MIQQTFVCDGDCGTQATPAKPTSALRPEGWLAVMPVTGSTLQFCSWGCLRSYILHHDQGTV